MAFRKALPLRQRLPYQGSCLRSRLRGWTKDSLTVSRNWAQPLRHRLRDATSPTEGRPWHSAKLCLFARGSPTRGAVERSETERLDKGWPDREALAKLNLSVIAYAMPPPLPRGGFGIPQSFASSPEAPLPGATATTAASGGNRESLLGPRPAGCKRQRSRRWVPQPGLGERSETERLYEGQPDRKSLTFGHSETGDAVCLYIICPMTAA